VEHALQSAAAPEPVSAEWVLWALASVELPLAALRLAARTLEAPPLVELPLAALRLAARTLVAPPLAGLVSRARALLERLWEAPVLDSVGPAWELLRTARPASAVAASKNTRTQLKTRPSVSRSITESRCSSRTAGDCIDH